MIDLRLVQPGNAAAGRFADRLIEHLDVPLYAGATGADGREAQDYIIGAARAIGGNLLNVGVHLHRYRELRFAAQYDQLQLLRQGLPYPQGQPFGRFHEREMEIDATEQALFAAIGAVVDCMAPTVVGVTGIDLPLRRVDYMNLLPAGSPDAYPDPKTDGRLHRALAAPEAPLRDLQVASLRALVGAVSAAGPTDWLTWTLGMRNTYVHREHRTEFITVIRDKAGRRIARLPPSNPDASNVQALKMGEGGEFRGFYLEEDLLHTLEGVVGSLVTTVEATLDVLGAAHDQRLARPALTLGARLSWTAPRETPAFRGYDPGSSVIEGDSVAVMNPRDVARLRWVQVLDGDRR